jgi:hypothetical protein
MPRDAAESLVAAAGAVLLLLVLHTGSSLLLYT